MKYYYRLMMNILMVSMSFADLASSQAQSYFLHGVVYGSDLNIQEAQYEIDLLPRRLPQYRNQNFLFKRGKWYVSVVLFSTKSDAYNARPIIENKYGRGSFVVELKKWCHPNWSKNTGVSQGISYFDCKRKDS